MAPRLENSLDYSCSPNHNTNVHGGGITEFKPRVGTWASVNSWSLSSRIVEDEGELSNHHHGQHRRQRRHQRVRFSGNHEVRDYLHRKDYTAEEKRSCWFRRSEYEAMRSDNAATLDKLMNRLPLDQQNESVFGLESHAHLEDRYRCHQIIRCAILAVLHEQDDQRRYDGSINDQVLAARYLCCTWEARDRALRLGAFQSLIE